jgi:hypothetical protein
MRYALWCIAALGALYLVIALLADEILFGLPRGLFLVLTCSIVPLVALAAIIVGAVRAGSLETRLGSCDRTRHPRAFWTALGVLALVATLYCFITIRFFLGEL